MIVARKALLNCETKEGLVAGCRYLLIRGQSRGIDVRRIRHTQSSRLFRHKLRKFGFAAGNCFTDHDRGIICRTGHKALNRVLDRERLIGLETEFCGWLQGGEGRDL